jgi:nicotinate-nucleotide pyrophosphorylase (carboxylating)
MILMWESLVRAALLEDLGRAGDITTEACVPSSAQGDGVLAARVAGTIAGLDVAALSFRLIDRVEAGGAVARVRGPARGMLTAERVALNFLGHLSGIATATRFIADAIGHTACRVVCTRKTTPGLRALEKYAVRCGGGLNHRFGLDDAMLIKDNHIALAGGIAAALQRARARAGHLVKIEIEVDNLAQLEEVFVAGGADAVLLDAQRSHAGYRPGFLDVPHRGNTAPEARAPLVGKNDAPVRRRMSPPPRWTY